MNTDELIEQMQKDELEDAPLLSVIDAARFFGLKPQILYYYIRTGKLETETCNCGRKCVRREVVQQLLKVRDESARVRQGLPRIPAETQTEEDT
ncbi:MAG TPA: hypothetical protein VM715_00680 [Candidatus Acidoferrum sp.]|nr:hypothetical protein [Candidatus Acidoferrum sp.]